MTIGAAAQRATSTAKSVKGPPPWTRDEVILACAIHVKNDWRRLDRNHPDVLELSRLLRSAPYHDTSLYGANFRNKDSVSLKTSNLKTANPGYDPAKAKTKGGKLAEEVVLEFIADTPGMLIEAARIRASLLADVFPAPVIPVEIEPLPVIGPAERIPVSGFRIKRIDSRADKVKKWYSHTCQICRRFMRAAGGTTTSQGAHFRALKFDGPDHESNIGCLCGFCHAEYDAGGIYIDDDFAVRDAKTKVIDTYLYVLPQHAIDKNHLRYQRASFGLDSHPEFPPAGERRVESRLS